MLNLSKLGRIFYGISIAAMGLLTLYYHDFPYFLVPPKHEWLPAALILVNLTGVFLFLSGILIAVGKRTRTISLVLGTVLLLIFCFYFIPYLFWSGDYKDIAKWENAEKELSMSCGAFLIAACYPAKNENAIARFMSGLIPFVVICFPIIITIFGIYHFLYADDVATLVPSWIPYHLFWTYLAGTALIASGIAIMFRIKRKLAATLLGTMIFIWVVILHIPRVIHAPVGELNSEISSAFLALAYSGIAFVISRNDAEFSKGAA